MKEPRVSPCIVIALFLILLVAFAQGQVPQGIPYQAIARNGQGQPLANLPVKIRFSVLDSTLTGTAVYSETHEPVTSAQGLFSVNVGMGNSTIGSFSSINWGVNAKFLKVELDTTASGSNYLDLGTQQMMSVPYALHAATASAVAVSSNYNGNTLVQGLSNANNTNFTFWQAVNYCANLTESSFTDWRLPKLDELLNWTSLNGIPNDGLYSWTITPSTNGTPSPVGSLVQLPGFYVVGVDGTNTNGYISHKVVNATDVNYGFNNTLSAFHPTRCIR